MSYYHSEIKHYVAVDCVIFGFQQGSLNLLLLKRKMEPAQGQWSLMGGFVREGESVDDAAKRVLAELTGLENVYMEQVHTFGAINRDPGERVISVVYYALINIDEYDRAITDTFGTESQGKILKFLADFMSATLKDNECLQMAYITGVMQVAKAGMFSGMNNLIVDDLFSKRSDERFGFTEKEVESILEYYEHPEKIDEVREWYDGYRFGDAEVYNPFSLMSYVSSGFEPLGYWSSSGNDMPIRWMMDRTDKRSVDTVADIISGIPTVSDMHVDLTYADMRRSRGTDLYSLMVMTGYLKAVPREDGRFDISIPNKEVRRMVDRVLKDVVPVDDSLFRDFAVAAMDGDAASMEELLGRLLEGSSYFDLKDESDYKLALFLCLHGIIWHYDVGCEMDRGNGRLDIIMRPRDGSVRPTIMELKISDRESSLEADAEGGIRQIHERKYYNRMRGEVLLYGISFWGVIPKVVVERIVL